MSETLAAQGYEPKIRSLQSCLPKEVRNYAETLPYTSWPDFYAKFSVREIVPLMKTLSSGEPNDNDALHYRRILERVRLICDKMFEAAKLM